MSNTIVHAQFELKSVMTGLEPVSMIYQYPDHGLTQLSYVTIVNKNNLQYVCVSMYYHQIIIILVMCHSVFKCAHKHQHLMT